MSQFDISTSHPIIPNSQEYMYETKYLSINSLDIDQNKYPNVSNFEIELPQDYCNIQSITLSSWIFPNNLNTFTKYFRNLNMTFMIDRPYRPTSAYVPASPTAPSYTLLEAIYQALYYKYNSSDPNFLMTIEEGTYTVTQMGFELSNQFNYTVSQYIIQYFTDTSDPNLAEFTSTGEYTQFIMITDPISQIMNFGNKSSGFILTNDSQINYEIRNRPICSQEIGDISPANTLYGLSYSLGFISKGGIPLSYPSIQTDNLQEIRFFGLQTTTGFWLTPSYNDSNYVYYVKAPDKWNVFSGRYYAFMDIDKFNSLDETQQFNTETGKATPGKVNSAFAKIPIYTNSNFPSNNVYYNNQNIDNIVRVFNPPINRIRRLGIRLRYHNGEYLFFAGETYSFTLKFNLFLPQNAKKYTMYKPESF
jgi:hypothetical protein